MSTGVNWEVHCGVLESHCSNEGPFQHSDIRCSPSTTARENIAKGCTLHAQNCYKSIQTRNCVQDSDLVQLTLRSYFFLLRFRHGNGNKLQIIWFFFLFIYLFFVCDMVLTSAFVSFHMFEIKAIDQSIVSLLQPQLEHTTKMDCAGTGTLVQVALCFYTCGSFYQAIGDGVSRNPVRSVVVSSASASLVNQLVKFPTNPEEIKQIKFYEMEIMPNSIGVKLHSCPHPSTPREGMGVCEQERTAQH